MNPELPEAGSRQTVLFAKLKERLNRTPFAPFRVVTTSGRKYRIPTSDHAVLFPMLRMLYIADDSGGEVEIHALHVSSIESLHPRRRAA